MSAGCNSNGNARRPDNSNGMPPLPLILVHAAANKVAPALSATKSLRSLIFSTLKTSLPYEMPKVRKGIPI